MKCNLCGCKEFGTQGTRNNVRCIQCGSLERTRLLWLYLESMGIRREAKVLHLAPEIGIYQKLRLAIAPENYIVADFNPLGYSFAENVRQINLCDLEMWPSREFDLIIHSHVLEHVPCNIAYSLFHIHRMLKNTGQHICIIPFATGGWDECFDLISDDERVRRFGQADHVRKFGRNNIHDYLGGLINIPIEFDAASKFSENVLLDANIPENHWRGFHAGTVLCLKRNDMKLLQETT